MTLSDLQKRIMRTLAPNRSESSYFAGGLVLNRDWPRRSEDIDVFHDRDEDVVVTAEADIRTLEEAGFHVSVDVKVFGVVEATVRDGSDATLIQWMGETRQRYLPLVRDADWGARLHQADLAVNKTLAAATRTKARDFVDLVLISENFCPLGPLVLAAAGKPPQFSPQRIIDEIRRRGLSVLDEDLLSVAGLPPDWTAEVVRARLAAEMDRAEHYIGTATPEVIGCLALDPTETPVEVAEGHLDRTAVTLRQATSEPEVMPIPDGAVFGDQGGDC